MYHNIIRYGEPIQSAYLPFFRGHTVVYCYIRLLQYRKIQYVIRHDDINIIVRWVKFLFVFLFCANQNRFYSIYKSVDVSYDHNPFTSPPPSVTNPRGGRGPRLDTHRYKRVITYALMAYNIFAHQTFKNNQDASATTAISRLSQQCVLISHVLY